MQNVTGICTRYNCTQYAYQVRATVSAKTPPDALRVGGRTECTQQWRFTLNKVFLVSPLSHRCKGLSFCIYIVTVQARRYFSDHTESKTGVI